MLASNSGIGSVIKYWCANETQGTFLPNIFPTSAALYPAAFTTYSHVIFPSGVVISHSSLTRFAFVAGQNLIILPPLFFAPLARAWVN